MTHGRRDDAPSKEEHLEASSHSYLHSRVKLFRKLVFLKNHTSHLHEAGFDRLNYYELMLT